jgi:hypothetical protein
MFTYRSVLLVGGGDWWYSSFWFGLVEWLHWEEGVCGSGVRLGCHPGGASTHCWPWLTVLACGPVPCVAGLSSGRPSGIVKGGPGGVLTPFLSCWEGGCYRPTLIFPDFSLFFLTF